MDNNWAENEFSLTDLGDQRLNKRLIQIADSFSQTPESPINHACQNWAETKAAYRFFDNENVSYKEILNSHVQATKDRAQECSTILAIQDTTYFNYTSHPQTTGLCPLTKFKGKHKESIITSGLVMHSTIAVSTDGLPLGILNQKIYSRPEVPAKKKMLRKKSHNKALPTEEKDSVRWLEALKETDKHFPSQSQRVVTVCDREADMYDFFRLADSLNASLLVRANYNRTVNKSSTYSETTGIKLWTQIQKNKIIAKIEVRIPKGENSPARLAKCQVKVGQFALNVPKDHVEKKNLLPILNLHAIYVIEKNPPKGTDPIEWMLLTNLPVKTRKEALEKIQWYCLRWRIEVFHKILKSGFKVEDCRLATAKRLIRYLSLISVVAWRIFWITMIARVSPQAPCLLFLSDFEWKVLFTRSNRKSKIPKKPPSVKESVQWIAQLGGFLARKSDKDPGIKHVWRGLRKFSNILEGVEIAQDIYG